MTGQKVIIRYSRAFQQKVVSEIESGKLTITEARRLYDIKGVGTIHKWIKKLGKNHLIAKVVRVEMKDERDKIKQLQKEKQELESALAQAHVKMICLESLIECAEEEFNIDLKKKFGSRQPIKHSVNSKQKK